MKYIPIVLAIVIWSWAGILIKYLQQANFDPYSQNFYRYGASALMVLIASAALDRQTLISAARGWHKFLLPALFCTLYQTIWVVGFYSLAPTFASLLGRSNIIITIVIAVLFVPEERVLVANWKFLVATAVALIAVAGVILFHKAGSEGAKVEGSFAFGVTMVIIGSGMWVLYAFAAKRVVREYGALVSFAGSSFFMSVFLLGIALFAHFTGRGDLTHVGRVSAFHLTVLFGSGLLCVALAQSIYYKSIGLIGVSVSQIILLVSPLIVGLISYFMYGERLTAAQWASGIVLLGALAYIINLQRRMHAST